MLGSSFMALYFALSWMFDESGGWANKVVGGGFFIFSIIIESLYEYKMDEKFKKLNDQVNTLRAKLDKENDKENDRND